MDRPRLLLFSALGILLFGVCYWVWSGWGLITVHADGQSLAEVIRSIEKQGGITLKTNMDSAQPVTLHVDKVPLTDALESLSAVTDSRWRLAYIFGADKGVIENRLALLASGERRPEGWISFDVPMGGESEDAIPPDPRRDTWTVKEPEEKTLQAYLRSAATNVSAGFWCPEEFNPAVASAPSSGQIRKRAPDLAKAAGAKVEELFLLLGRPAGMADNDEPRDRGDDAGRRQRREGDFSLIRDRRLAEIAKLPPAQREAAQKEFEEISTFMRSLRDLPEDERRAKREEFFQNGDRIERMEERRMEREERKTPEQRRKQYQRYVERKKSGQS
jgi:hypothetical protein